MWAKITKDNTFVEGGMIEMQEAIQKRAMGEGSYMIPSFDYSAYSSIEIKKLGKPKFRRIREPYKLLPDSFLLPKNGPYTPTFDKFIMRAFDHGLFKKISYKYQFREGVLTVFENYSKCRILIFSEELAYYATKKSEDTKEAVPLTMKPFYAIFILCGIFYLLSTICFLFEIIHEFIKKKLTRQNQTPIVDSIGLEVMEE